MDKTAVKDLIFGGIDELMQDKRYYYYSSSGHHYSHWTEAGKQALLEYMQVMGWKLRQAQEEDLDRRAKDMVLRELKS